MINLIIIKPYWFIWIKIIQNISLLFSFVLLGGSAIVSFVKNVTTINIDFNLLMYFLFFLFVFLISFLLDILIKRESLIHLDLDDKNQANDIYLQVNIYKGYPSYWGHFIKMSHHNSKKKYLFRYDSDFVKIIPKEQIKYANWHPLILEKTSKILKESLNLLWAIN
ncbi:hypothetical protein BCY89_09620 [Sphingobacterium siyangense]|uniref:Uncharacterized protein n=1 Tax=Sphingobacterium siyangense TaxID=459529 RepID=A0A420FQH6_9SPHI|nr:hypothetical protein BCY89_09620 [Sphingobacterium siyangense]